MAPLGSVRSPANRSATRSPASNLHIFDDGHGHDADRLTSPRNCSTGTWGALQELNQANIQNQHPSTEEIVHGFANLRLASPETKSKPQVNSRTPRRRRPPVDLDTFEPLDVVQEEVSGFADSESSAIHAASPDYTSGQVSRRSQNQGYPRSSPATHLTVAKVAIADIHLENHPLIGVEPDSPLRQQVLKHLAGQFEWLVSYPAPVGSAEHHDSLDEDNAGRVNAKGNLVYGCNLLSRVSRYSRKGAVGCPQANRYTLIATPLGHAHPLPDLPQSSAVVDQVSMAMTQTIDQVQVTPQDPIKAPGMVKVTEQAASPSLSVASERQSIYLTASPAGSFSIPRIEDSFEELDKLEDQLEAVNAVTTPRRVSQAGGQPSNEASQDTKKPAASKRVSIAGQFATVRAKPSAKARPTIRRSASMTLRDDSIVSEAAPEQKTLGSLSRAKSTAVRPTDSPKPLVKSTKPPTVPNFELPGEAVSRRLKEQREARQQRAEAQKTYVGPPRPKSSRPLTKSTFELPGEAISRRKREEHEARVKAQEEEERKRREFKARPIRQSVGSMKLPRDTITSRARQGKPPQEDSTGQQVDARGSRRSIASFSRPSISTSTASSSTLGRGRNSTTASQDDMSRATSESIGSTSGKRSTLSGEEAGYLRLRGKDVIQRDNSFSQERERERKERETNAKSARDEAAERSRAASREWAEKKRRRDLALKAAMQEAMLASNEQPTSTR